LHDAYVLAIFICMRTTLILDDELVAEASRLTGVTEKTALVHAGLRALIAREAGRRLAALGGTEPDLEPIPRRRVAEPKR
jgi:Arc/MetJ family transcription regulator